MVAAAKKQRHEVSMQWVEVLEEIRRAAVGFTVQEMDEVYDASKKFVLITADPQKVNKVLLRPNGTGWTLKFAQTGMLAEEWFFPSKGEVLMQLPFVLRKLREATDKALAAEHASALRHVAFTSGEQALLKAGFERSGGCLQRGNVKALLTLHTTEQVRVVFIDETHAEVTVYCTPAVIGEVTKRAVEALAMLAKAGAGL